MKTINVGDTVAYSSKFLRSIGEVTDDMPFARGIVLELIPLGQTTLARIEWNTIDLPMEVNVLNLVTKLQIQLGENE